VNFYLYQLVKYYLPILLLKTGGAKVNEK